MNPLEELKSLINEIETVSITDETALETFRIRFLGSKNILKPLSASIRDVPNEQKKGFIPMPCAISVRGSFLFLLVGQHTKFAGDTVSDR